MTELERELKLLTDLDKLDYVSWLPLVKYMAPEICRLNNKLMAEIIIRRGKQICDGDAFLDKEDHTRRIEKYAQLFGYCGLKIVVDDPMREKSGGVTVGDNRRY